VNKLVKIRAFEPKDVGVVIDLLQDVSEYRPATDTILALAEEFVARENCYACVAIFDGSVIGFGSVFVMNRLRGGGSGIVEDFVVAAPFRRRGVGKIILDALLGFAKARGCFKVTLEAAHSAEQFYDATGFVRAGRVMKFML
jgi:glucosamine-phosphate N-acetyltransferase